LLLRASHEVLLAYKFEPTINLQYKFTALLSFRFNENTLYSPLYWRYK